VAEGWLTLRKNDEGRGFKNSSGCKCCWKSSQKADLFVGSFAGVMWQSGRRSPDRYYPSFYCPHEKVHIPSDIFIPRYSHRPLDYRVTDVHTDLNLCLMGPESLQNFKGEYVTAGRKVVCAVQYGINPDHTNLFSVPGLIRDFIVSLTA
jgi:hypothetical protein